MNPDEKHNGRKRRRGMSWSAKWLLAALALVMAPGLFFLSVYWWSPRNEEFFVEGDELDIRLIGVRLDQGDDVIGVDGIVATRTLGLLDKWSAQDSYPDGLLLRDFIFALPDGAPEWEPFGWPVVRPSFLNDEGWQDSISHPGKNAHFFPYRLEGGRQLFLGAVLHTTHEVRRLPFWSTAVPVEKVDIKLRFIEKGRPRGPADFTFKGPFKNNAVARAGSPGREWGMSVLVAKSEPLGYVRLTLSMTDTDDFADRPVAVYDVAGRRQAPVFFDINYDKRDRCWWVRYDVKLPLDRIAYVTVGERNREKVFRNVPVVFPGRPPRAYPESLDRLAEILPGKALSPAKLADFTFRFDASDNETLVRAAEIVRGEYLRRLSSELESRSRENGKLGAKFSKLAPEQRKTLRQVARSWAKAGDPAIHELGLKLGLRGHWREFVDPAFQYVEGDNPPVGSVVSELLYHSPDLLTAADFERTRQILARTENGGLVNSIFYCLRESQAPGATRALRRLAEEKEVWLWWSAIEYLIQRKALAPDDEFSRELKKRIILVRGEVWLKDGAALVGEAYAMLPGLFSAKSRTLVNASRYGDDDLFRALCKHADRAAATDAFIHYLREVEVSVGTRTYIDRTVRQLNDWHGVNLGRLGADVTHQTRDLEQGLDWGSIIADAVEWRETGVDPGALPKGYQPRPGDLRIVWKNLDDPEQSRIDLWRAPAKAGGRARTIRLEHEDDFLSYKIAPSVRSGNRQYEVTLWRGVLDRYAHRGEPFVFNYQVLPKLVLGPTAGREVRDLQRALWNWEVWIERADSAESVLSDTELFKRRLKDPSAFNR